LKAVPKLNLNIPDHTILDKIGEGGMSTVYLGRQISLQRKVAIKILKKLVTDDKSLAERFVAEAKTVASLDHPHIISIYEAKKLPSGLAYFTMPYLTHGDFSEIICTNSDHLIELLCQICDGLSHAHKHGIVHRDLKPDNILFDQFGRIKIADFGIAISQNAKRQTKETQLLGSAHYMSPEQIQSREINHRSDIYSLGCIIYEKLTGEHVFQAGNDFSILMSHINKPIPDLPDTLSEWQPIIDQCLAKDPKERFKKVEALKDALLLIKHNKQKTIKINTSKPAVNKYFKPTYLAIGLCIFACVLFTTLFVIQSSRNKDEEAKKLLETQLLAKQNAASLQAKKDQLKALELKVSVVENSEKIEEEVVDITGGLNNETINQMSIETMLKDAQSLLKRNRLTKPKGENAADKFQAILLEQPNNKTAQNGLNQVGNAYYDLIDNKLSAGEIPDAMKYMNSFNEYIDTYNIDRSLFEPRTRDLRKTTENLVTTAVNSRRKNGATEQYLQILDLLMPNYKFVTDLKASYNNIPQTGLAVSDQFGHEFIYFAVQNGSGLKDFMFGTNEVTVEQFARFAGEKFTEQKCHHYDKKVFFKKTWLKTPFDQTNQHPVVCINADQAQGYAQWLSTQTGLNYRLPSASEFQYMNQQLPANTNCQVANLAGAEVAAEKKATNSKYNCNDKHVFTAAVNSFQAQEKIHNHNGNVSEWVSNCDNQANCAMGTSWLSGTADDNNTPLSANPQLTYSHVGFRLIREL